MPKADLGIVLAIVSSCLMAPAADGQKPPNRATEPPVGQSRSKDPAIQRVAHMIQQAYDLHPFREAALASNRGPCV